MLQEHELERVGDTRSRMVDVRIAELKQRERANLVAPLAQTGGKIFGPTGAAALLGMKPTTVVSRLKALGLEGKKTSRRQA